MIIRAALRLRASTPWLGKFVDMPELPDPVRLAIEATMNRLSADYPSIAHVNVEYGDPEWIADALATKSNNILYLNKHYWTNLSEFDKVAKDWHEARVSNDFAGIIIHEVGHILTGQVSDKLGSRKFNNLLEKYLGKGNLNSISNEVSPSAYGQENIFEFTAEAFASFYLGKSALDRENELTLRAVKACREMWEEFNKVLHGKPKTKKAV